VILRGQFADKTFNGSNCNLKSLTELMHLEEIGAATPATAAKLLSEIGKEQSIARRHRHPTGPHSCWTISGWLKTLSIRIEKLMETHASSRTSSATAKVAKFRPKRQTPQSMTSHDNARRCWKLRFLRLSW
jgi:hypothetical protein